MTQWFADMEIDVRQTGPYGGRVRVGRFTYPKHVFVRLLSENGHPDLKMHLAWLQDRPEVIEFTVKAKPSGRGIRTTDISTFTLEALARDVFDRERMVIVRDDGETTVSAMPDWSDPRWKDDRVQGSRELDDLIATRRAKTSAAELELVAETYRAHRGKGVLQAVAIVLGVSERTAARRINSARAAGLLDGESE